MQAVHVALQSSLSIMYKDIYRFRIDFGRAKITVKHTLTKTDPFNYQFMVSLSLVKIVMDQCPFVI